MIKDIRVAVLIPAVITLLSACGSGDNEESNLANNDKTNVEKPTSKPNSEKPTHIISQSTQRKPIIQKATSGHHDLSASTVIMTQKASSESFQLDNAQSTLN
ncbi:hypothetical protein [Pseudoalteromonas piscicida]|uniref:hypothetical protein n=1 Tax=Pseudoalteromonas piscicida TaxID=43662 RepID=UPI00309FFC2F